MAGPEGRSQGLRAGLVDICTVHGAATLLWPLSTVHSGVPDDRCSVRSPALPANCLNVSSVQAQKGLETCRGCQEALQLWLLKFQLHLFFHLSPIFLSLSEACLEAGPICLERLAKNRPPRLSAREVLMFIQPFEKSPK